MQIENIKVNDIAPNPRQPRNVTEPVGEMETVGQIHPIMVLPMKRVPKGERRLKPYMVIDGHRRLVAVKAAGLKSIKAHIEDIDFEEAMLRALIANREQQTAGPVEEARAILDSLANRFRDELLAAYNKEGNEWSREWGRRLVTRAAQNIDNSERGKTGCLFCDDVVVEFKQWCGRAGYTVGAIQAHIAKYADIPPDLEERIAKKPGEPGKLSVGHAEELAKIKDEGLRKKAADTVGREGKTIRETHALQKAIRSDIVTNKEKIDLASGKMKPTEVKRAKPTEIFDRISKYWEECANKIAALNLALEKNDYAESANFVTMHLHNELSKLNTRINHILSDLDDDVIDAEIIEYRG